MRRVDDRQARRAFTVLEVAVVLAITVAILSVMAPVVAFRIDERRLADLRERLPAALGLAQLDAMRLGKAVELVRVRDEDGRERLVGRVFDTERSQSSRSIPAELDPDAEPTTEYLLVPSGYRVMLAGTSEADLARTASEVMADVDDGFVPPPLPGMPAGMDDGMQDRPGEIDELRLAVLLPDGSAFAAQRWQVADENGEGFRVELSAWTGKPTLTELDPEASDDPRFDPSSGGGLGDLPLGERPRRDRDPAIFDPPTRPTP